tara:strand:- start:2346 stop:2525 length:180 start_codon:yes stop_codon:yes gene_type:complete
MKEKTMIKKLELPDDITELKDIIELQLEEIKSLKNKLKLYTSGKMYNVKITYNRRTKNK